jgi:hypothetical protein
VIHGGVLALPVHKLTNPAEAEKGQPKKFESAVFLLSVADHLKPFMGNEAKPAAPPAPPKGMLMAKWKNEGEGAPPIDLAATDEDSKTDRLVAALTGQGPKKETTQFFELFPPGKGEPKLLFEAPKAGRPQWTPDGQAIVYLRANATNPAWDDLVLWRPGQKEPLVLAHLPGKDKEQDETITAWRWLASGRLRVFNVSRDGLRQVDMAADGTGAKARWLTPNRLSLQLHLALADRTKHDAPALQKITADGMDVKVKAALEAITAADKTLDEAREKLWPLAAEWEDVPALPEVPAPPPPPAPPTPPEGKAPPTGKN